MAARKEPAALTRGLGRVLKPLTLLKELVITNIFFYEKDSSGLIFQDADSLVVHSQQ